MGLNDSTEAFPETTSRAVRWVAIVVLPLLLLLVAALAAEALVRARQWSKNGTLGSYSDLYVTDNSIGLRLLRPSMQFGNVHVNSAGFRGPELITPKPVDDVRIAFLGASTTFAAEPSSDDAEVWPDLVVQKLRRRFPKTRFDYINGGVPGHTLSSTRKLLQARILALQPDIIVIFPGTNDLVGELMDLAVAQGLARPHDASSESWIARKSLLWELVAKNLRVISARQAARSGSQGLKFDPSELGKQFGPNLVALLKEASADAQRVAIATFPTQLRSHQSRERQLSAAVSAFVYMPFMSANGLIAAYANHNQLIEQAALAQGALLIGNEEAFPADPDHFVDTVHFANKGNQVMASRVADALASDPRVVDLIQSRRRNE